MKAKLIVKQMSVAQWRGSDSSLNYSVMGLGNDNKVYRWSKKKAKWELWKSEDSRDYTLDMDTEVF